MSRAMVLWFRHGMPRCKVCGRPILGGRPHLRHRRPHGPGDLRLRQNAAERDRRQIMRRNEYLEQVGRLDLTQERSAV